VAEKRVALLRGINVGPAKRVAMADLRALLAELGYSAVRTLLNSGNVVYTTVAGSPSDDASRIEAAVASQLGVVARVTVLTAAELDAAIAGNPLVAVADNPSRLLVAFVADPADLDRLAPLAAQDWGPEALVLGSRVVYLWCPAGVAASQVSKALNRALGDAVTSRNWSTVLKLQVMTRK